MSQMTFILFAIPGFIGTMLLEYLLSRRRLKRSPEAVRGYALKDTAASLAMGLGNVGISFLFKAASFGLYLWAYQYRLFEIPVLTWWVLPALIICEDFFYYWFHRAHHEVRFFWAAHVNHHSSQYYNLSTALRQSFTTPITGPIFWLPLAFIGFHPAWILLAQAISLLYQYWIHTELIGRMGRLEWVLNTPSHHRVHHGNNPEYLDRNYGGILIIWDRLFGTFKAEEAKVNFGLTTNIQTYNPLKIAFHEWAAMFRDSWRQRGIKNRVAILLRPPGWAPGAGSNTAAEMRRRAELAQSSLAPGPELGSADALKEEPQGAGE